jgi:hypothetical protein
MDRLAYTQRNAEKKSANPPDHTHAPFLCTVLHCTAAPRLLEAALIPEVLASLAPRLSSSRSTQSRLVRNGY